MRLRKGSGSRIARLLVGLSVLSLSGGVLAAPAPTVTISASPDTIMVGSSSTLTWSSTDATSCTASGSWGGSRATSGSLVVTPSPAGTKTYTLTCSGPGGSAASSATLTVNQPPPNIISFTTDKTEVGVGEQVTLSWTTEWANTCQADGSWKGDDEKDHVPVNGSRVLTLTEVQTYSFGLKCFGTSRRNTQRNVSVVVTSTPFGLTSRPVRDPLGFPSNTPQTGDVAVVKAFPNLTFSNPLIVTTAPNDNSKMYVGTQEGAVYVFANDPNTTFTNVFLDLRGKVNRSGGEVGLLGMAFDPNYASTGWIFVNYNPAGVNWRTRIARFTANADRTAIDLSTEKVLVDIDSVNDSHKAGWIGVGADGKVYTTVGDGRIDANAQDRSTLLGKVVRLNKDGSVPSDNPFVGVPGVRPEIWAYGFRNPFRASIDRGTGNLWVGDVGAHTFEEVDLVTKGGNYGWATREGTQGYPNASTPKPDGNNFIDPVAEYDHSRGCAVTGGNVYRGSAIGSLAGQYVFADYCGGTLLAFPATGQVSSPAPLGAIPSNPTSFGEDVNGELYVTAFDGNIYKLVPGSSSGTSKPFPTKLSQTGLFSDLVNLVPNPGLIEYKVRSPLWSDGAKKRRWIGLPNSGLIGFTPSGAWDFPVDTVSVKHFEMKLANGKTRRMETRVFINFPDGWQGYTYKWNSKKTDADLVGPDGDSEMITTPSGTQLYEWPSRTNCVTCHNAVAGRVLGLRTNQANTKNTFPNGVTDNQLRAYNHVHLFSTDIGDPAQYTNKLTDPSDTTATLTRRARSYLDVNCAICHQPGGITEVDMDLRVTTPRYQTNTLNVPPTQGDLGITGANRITPGNKEMSILWQRMNRLDSNRMPEIASHAIDPLGVDLIGQWIDAGAPAK